MFYTGIITSLLPYILLLGVCGTLLLNQALPGAQDKDDHSPAHHQREGTFVLTEKENSSSADHRSITGKSENEPEGTR